MPPTTDSFMYQTMHRQPADVRNLIDTGWGASGRGRGDHRIGPPCFRDRNRHQLSRRAGRRLVHPGYRERRARGIVVRSLVLSRELDPASR